MPWLMGLASSGAIITPPPFSTPPTQNSNRRFGNELSWIHLNLAFSISVFLVVVSLLPIYPMPADSKMELLELPPEILLQIGDETRPEGFESFILTCKRLHSLFKHDIVKHNRLKWQYRIINTLDVPRQDDQPSRDPLQWCWDLYTNEEPKAGLYARNLGLNYEHFDVPDKSSGVAIDPNLELYRNDTRFHKVLAKPMHFELTTEAVRQRMDNFYHHPYGFHVDKWALLLLQLPNIKELWWSSCQSGSLDIFVHLIENVYSHNTLRPDLTLPWAHIKRIWLQNAVSGRFGRAIPPPEVDLNEMAMLRRLPSLEWLGAKHARGYGDTPFDNTYFTDSRACAIKTMQFRESDAWGKDLTGFFSPLVNLRMLAWGQPTHFTNSIPWDAGKFIQTIAEATKGRLEGLGVYSDPYNIACDLINLTVPIKDLFPDLRFAIFDLRILRELRRDSGPVGPARSFLSATPGLDPRGFKLVDFVPQTIRAIKIIIPDYTRQKYHERLLDGLLESREERVPRLRRIVLEYLRIHQGVEDTRNLVDQYDAAGIDLQVLSMSAHPSPWHWVDIDETEW